MFKYQNPSLPVKKRVRDLMKRMTLEEKTAQLCATLPMLLLEGEELSRDKMDLLLKEGIGRIPQFPMPFARSARQVAEAYNAVQKYVLENTRLGIPFMAQVECLNGVTAVDATSFPAPIAMASSWEPELVRRAGEITGRQMRALTGGSNALAPVVDLGRDPRWGRVYETYGECSYMNSAFGAAYVRGLQNDGDLKTGVQSCAKHFLGYSYTQGGLNSAAVEIGGRDLYESFGRPFETMFHEADLKAVMCTYSEIDGKPVSFSPEILRDLLRDRMGFEGSAICDGGSIKRGCDVQKAAADMEEAGILALEAGLDADAPISQCYTHLPDAIRAGKVKRKLLDEACARVLTQKFELGLFEEPYVDTDRAESLFGTAESDAATLELSRKSLVLLKNEGNLLPLTADPGRVAVIGPHGDSVMSLFGGYTYPAYLDAMRTGAFSMEGVNEGVDADGEGDGIFSQLSDGNKLDPEEAIELYCRRKYRVGSVAEEIASRLTGGEVLKAKGCAIDDRDRSLFGEAKAAARQADLVIMTLGGKCGWGADATSGEGKDRASISLPGVQEELLKEIKALGKPVILVLFNGRPMEIGWASEHVDAVLEVWFPGPMGGRAVAEALLGEINPGGKLPVTIPRHVGQVPIYYSHKNGSGYDKTKGGLEAMFGDGYTDIENSPLYPFGFGLSYSSFEYAGLDLSTLKVDSAGGIEISVFVKNTGDRRGEEVVQFYMRDLEARVTRPVKELVGFRRISLDPGEMKKVTLFLKMSQLGFVNEKGDFVVEPGKMAVMIGPNSRDITHTGIFSIIGQVRSLAGRRTYLSHTEEETVTRILLTEHTVEKESKNYSLKTTLGTLLDDEEGRAVLVNELGDKFLNNPQLDKVRGMSLKTINLMVGRNFPAGAIDRIERELKKL